MEFTLTHSKHVLIVDDRRTEKEKALEWQRRRDPLRNSSVIGMGSDDSFDSTDDGHGLVSADYDVDGGRTLGRC